jgi:hypothetical protein
MPNQINTNHNVANATIKDPLSRIANSAQLKTTPFVFSPEMGKASTQAEILPFSQNDKTTYHTFLSDRPSEFS